MLFLVNQGERNKNQIMSVPREHTYGLIWAAVMFFLFVVSGWIFNLGFLVLVGIYGLSYVFFFCFIVLLMHTK